MVWQKTMRIFQKFAHISIIDEELIWQSTPIPHAPHCTTEKCPGEILFSISNVCSNSNVWNEEISNCRDQEDAQRINSKVYDVQQQTLTCQGQWNNIW